MTADEVSLFYAVSRIVLLGDGRSMADQVSFRQTLSLPGGNQYTRKIPSEPVRTIRQQNLYYSNGIGGFSPDGHEYVIQLEKSQMTPAPWVNVIANQKFGFIVSEAGSGYTWYGNSRENKLTPWKNDAVSDGPGEVLYISDRDTGQLWTPTALPIREDEPYTIKHGFGYSVFEHVSNGIAQSLSQHVPVDDAVKVSILTLHNTSTRPRNLTMTYYLQPVLGVSDQFTAMHIRSKSSESGVLMLENPYNEDYASHVSFLAVSSSEQSCTSDRKEFFGSGDIRRPRSEERRVG